jgi:glycosyltransferase involved in cell wall biosynthesis
VSAADQRTVSLVASIDDPDLIPRLRAAAWWGVRPTLFAPPNHATAARLARAAGADLGSIWPDRSRPAVRVDASLTAEAFRGLSDRTVVLANNSASTATTVGRILRRVVEDDLVRTGSGGALQEWDDATLGRLIDRGWRITPVAAPDIEPVPRLDGLRAIHITSVHRPDDGRIFEKEVRALRAAGADATVLGLTTRPARAARLRAGWSLVREAARREADVFHVHDPELLPAAAWLTRRTRRPVIYDAHEYLGQSTRTKPWIPGPLRLPTAVAVERIERVLAARLAAVVTVTEDMAVGFAAGGIPAISVANYAPRDRFAEPGAPEPGTVAYVGALDRSRGLEVMRTAFPMVDVPDARLMLAGPGDPGDLPPRVTHLGPLAYDAVPGVLQRASVIWVPLQRSPNNDRGRLTKVLEAMGTGRPLVVSDLTRTAAIVRQAGCGLVVPAGHAAAHAAAISGLLRDPEAARRMGHAGRRTVLERMTFETEAAKLVRLYAEVAAA